MPAVHGQVPPDALQPGGAPPPLPPEPGPAGRPGGEPVEEEEARLGRVAPPAQAVVEVAPRRRGHQGCDVEKREISNEWRSQSGFNLEEPTQKMNDPLTFLPFHSLLPLLPLLCYLSFFSRLRHSALLPFTIYQAGPFLRAGRGGDSIFLHVYAVGGAVRTKRNGRGRESFSRSRDPGDIDALSNSAMSLGPSDTGPSNQAAFQAVELLFLLS